MLVFAHLGLTLAAASCARKLGLRPDLVFVAIGSLLPDMIDKPLGQLIYGSMATGRIFAHTLLFLLVLAVLAAILRSPKVASLSGGVFCHLVLDSIWATPSILFWPLLGDFPVNPELSVLGYFEMLVRGLENAGILVPEIIGFLYLAYVISQTWPKIFVASKRIARTQSQEAKFARSNEPDIASSIQKFSGFRFPQNRRTEREGGAFRGDNPALPEVDQVDRADFSQR